jgi:hypothetical protein
MSITTTPAPARTDEPVRTASVRSARRTGWFVAAGSGVWAGAMALYSPQDLSNVAQTVNDMGALPFQASLFALVTLQLRTAATGTSRVARAMLRTEYVLLALASLWTVLHGFFPAFRDDAWLAVLDAFWPLSMLGMFVIGVKIAFAGRWTGPARIWPLVAESWAVVTVPTMIIFGTGVVQAVGAGHLLVGYVTLGVIIATRPHLTGARG